MSLMPDSEFLAHQAFLGYGYAGLVRVQESIQSGLNLVVDSSDIDVELDALTFYNRNLANVNVSSTVSLLRLATEALQRHVTTRSGQTFNDYLFFRGLKVTQDFADLSDLLGAPISPTNVET